MDKEFIQGFAVWIVFMLILYIGGAIAAWSFNMSEWSEGGRVLFAIAFVVISIFAICNSGESSIEINENE